ncbi:porin [Mitsuokella multacida]|uniref:porin n=1 Tax=Mitsuokella multacida TaxID=52226 RepID=UPI0022E73A0C|nr:porin [Mitsuokella multacida]
MKKTLVSALTTALVVGAASTTFAAANPFSDVPTDHWAYDAVSQLAADGVIEGYGDTTFRGNQNITRYEMAQMIAKAMAKSDVSAADKALIDKLAAEFSDELNNLGVRVSNLERNADKVKWTGEARYTYTSARHEDEKNDNTDKLQFRLYPTAEVNNNWHVNARLTANTDLSSDKGEDGNVKLTYVYADGQYGNFNVKLGKMPLYSVADDGLVLDDFFSGAQVNFGKDLKATLEAGRWNLANDANGHIADAATNDDAANYQGAELNYGPNKLRLGAAYRHFNSAAFTNIANYSNDSKTDDANIWSVGAGYKFDHNWNLFGAFAQNTEADNYDTAHNIQLSYKGSDIANKGTWGAYAAYRYLGQNVSLMPTYDTAHYNHLNEKGWEVGASYVPFTNVYTAVEYFDGKDLATDRDAKTLFGRVSFFF